MFTTSGYISRLIDSNNVLIAEPDTNVPCITNITRSRFMKDDRGKMPDYYGKQTIDIYSSKYKVLYKQTRNVLNLVQDRELHSRFSKDRVLPNFGIRQLLHNQLFEEFPIQLNSDKVFCAIWLSDQVILMGTKCNKLLVYNIISNKLFNIPCLKSSSNSLSCDHHCGIHAVAANPSKTRLATGASNSNDIAVYSLPDFEPICVGEGAHSDWVFDIKWLDDEFFVSGARDGKIALWHVSDSVCYPCGNLGYHHMNPVMSKTCAIADKIRALHFNPPHELIAISLNAYIHLWDMRNFKRLYSRKLPFPRENVCLTYNETHNVYAVGSFLNVAILEGSKLSTIKNIDYQSKAYSIRSVGFQNDLLTMGTGLGTIFFYDMLKMDFVSTGKKPMLLSATGGKITEGDSEFSNSYTQFPAIYTHSYDSVGTRLFAAGGPLPMNFHGYYAAIWQ